MNESSLEKNNECIIKKTTEKIGNSTILHHKTIIGTGITCEKVSCYMRESVYMWRIVENAKTF